MKLTAWERFPYPVRKAWRIMRVTTLLILVISLHLSAKTTAQKITLSSNNISIEQFFNQLEKQTGYSFLLENGIISKDEKISVNVKDASLETVLDQILKPINLSYKIENKTVYVQKTKETTTIATLDNAPPDDIHGRVTDSLGNPLSGASILIKGTRRGTTTDANGYFILSGVKENALLNISYTGYIHKEYNWTGDASFSVTLIKSNNPLDAVVVIPYGTTTQRLNTGDVGTVTSKTIEQQPVSNVLEALEGQVPGLLITQTTGLPGGGFKVQIRGQNSIASRNDPFYVIDGVPYNSQLPDNPINPNLNTGSPLNFINPNDIESVEVLKDADATAIYGSRAANGAILITTKKGKAGSMKTELSIRSGITEPARTVDLLNTQQYLAMRHEAFNNDAETSGPGDHDINGDWDSTRYTDWQKVMANKPAPYTDANASVSGGNTNTQFLVGVGYNIQKTGYPTLLPGDGGDKKGSVHFNITSFSQDKRFKLMLSGSYLADKNTVQSQDFTALALTLSPDAPALFNSDGSLNWAPLAPGQLGTWTNPYSSLYDTYVSNTSNLVANGTLGYTLLKGLDLTASFGYTNTQTNEFQTVPTTSYDPGYHVPSGGSVFNASNTHSWIIEPQINYHLSLAQGVLTALAGGSYNESNTNYVATSATGFISDALLQDIQAAGSVSTQNNSSQYKYEAIFGRLGYNWKDKYLINFNARRDGTSRFGPGKQFGNFWAVGAGWIFTKEEFFQKNLGFLSFGKLRGSYGTTGNDQIGDYQYVDLYNATRYSYQGSQGLHPTNLFNPLLAWEITKKLEGGIELGFFKDRIMIQASFYQNRSGNQLVQTPVSIVTGFSAISSNLPATVQNTGKEFVLNTINIKSKNFGWTSSINLTIARNKLLSFPNLVSSTYASTLVIGQPITVLQLYHCLGVNDTTGLYEFASSKTGPTYSPNYLTDLATLVDLTPKYYGGFQNSFSYKGFSLDVFFQFVKQTGLQYWAASSLIPGTMFNEPTLVLNRWQKPGDKKPYEQFTQDYGSAAASALGYAQNSDYAYGDASFIRLKNLAISWQMPQAMTRKSGFGNIRVFIQCQNLLTITKYQGLDPENQSPSIGPRRAYAAGVSVGW
jgi:TonB-dependent starch-binding outer membrane protein SusC